MTERGVPHRSIPTVSRTSIGQRPADTQCIVVTSGAQQPVVDAIVLCGGGVSDCYISHDMEAAPEAQPPPLS